MSERVCPQCRKAMEPEAIGRRGDVIVSYCPACCLVVLPRQRHLAVVPDYPRSSSDRLEESA
jgi:Zn-finger nucleic acid-binding protein